MERNTMSGVRHDFSNQSLFDGIVLGRTEEYDASKLLCCDFYKGTDYRDGIELKFGNQLINYPFECEGKVFKCSEMLYLCGQFSRNTDFDLNIQRLLCQCNNGFAAKRFVKDKYKDFMRADFAEFRVQWMLWVVWQKVKQNKDFQDLLLSIPEDAVIIENTSTQIDPTALVWGCKNKELKRLRRKIKKEVEQENTHLKKKELAHLVSVETNKVINVGTFIGENNMGKALMLCRIALKHNTTPPIDYQVLRDSEIYLFGKMLTFEKE